MFVGRTAAEADDLYQELQSLISPALGVHYLSKMLVHRRARRRGVGEALLRAAEDLARDHGKWLLVLDTASAEAERLYARAGWVRVGLAPGFALWPEGGVCDTTFFYRKLGPKPS